MATQRVEAERDALVQSHEEAMRAQGAQLDQVRVNARLAEEERQRILAEAAEGPAADVIPPDAQAQIAELTQQLERSEAERAMLRAGRPETVYEARNRQLEDELAELRAQLGGGAVRSRSQDAPEATSMLVSMPAWIPTRSRRWRNGSRPRKSGPARPSAGWTKRSRGVRGRGDAAIERQPEGQRERQRERRRELRWRRGCRVRGGCGSARRPAGGTCQRRARARRRSAREGAGGRERAPEPFGAQHRRSATRISTPTAVPTPGPTKRR